MVLCNDGCCERNWVEVLSVKQWELMKNQCLCSGCQRNDDVAAFVLKANKRRKSEGDSALLTVVKHQCATEAGIVQRNMSRYHISRKQHVRVCIPMRSACQRMPRLLQE